MPSVRRRNTGRRDGAKDQNSRSRKQESSLETPLETYLRDINETALLSVDDEKELAKRIAEGDRHARDRMVRANLRLVVKIARGYTGKGLASAMISSVES